MRLSLSFTRRGSLVRFQQRPLHFLNDSGPVQGRSLPTDNRSRTLGTGIILPILPRLAAVLSLVSLAACGASSPTRPSAPVQTPAAVTPTEPTPPPAPLPETWIVAGQSNAVGCGESAGPAPSPHVLLTNGQPATDPLPFVDPYPGCLMGPWVTAAQLTGREVRVTGYAQANTYLKNWIEGSLGDLLVSRAQGTQASWFLWYQGESEGAYLDGIGQYAERLNGLIGRVRLASGNPAMRVLIVGLADAPSGYRDGYATMRGIQQQIAQQQGGLYVSAEGLPLRHDQPFHLSSEGQRQLGGRISDALTAAGR